MTSRFEEMTEDELLAWEERHLSLITWEGRWNAMATVFLTASLVLALFMNQYLAAAAACGFALVFLIARNVCITRHVAIHDEYGSEDYYE